MKNIYFLFSIFVQCIFSKGQSTQLVGPDPMCSNDVATYQCTRSGGTVISWTVMSTCGGDTARTFGSFNIVGTVFNITQCNSQLSFRLTSITNSSISSTLTIHRPLPLNGTRITCLDMTTQLLVITDINFLWPTRLILLSTSTQEPVSNFIITWEPKQAASTNIVHYSVAVTPAPPYGPTNTTNSSVSVSLQLDLLYNITITQNACSQEHTSSFTLRCPLAMNPAQKFTIELNGTLTAHLHADNLTEIITCYTQSRTTNMSEVTTTDKECIMTATNQESKELRNKTYFPVCISGILAGSVIAVIMSSTITAVILKIFFEVKCKKRSKIYSPSIATHSHNNSIQNTTGPVYEEINLTDANTSLNYSQNVAYQCTLK